MSLTSLVALTVTLAAPPAADKNAALLKMMQGRWDVTRITQGRMSGTPREIGVEMAFVIKGDTIVRTNKPDEPGKITLDASQSPAHVKLAGNNPKKASYGIVRVEGDRMTMCLGRGLGPAVRPKKFASPKGSGAILLELKRVRKK